MLRVRPVTREDEHDWLRMRCSLFGDDPGMHATEIRRFLQGQAAEPEAVLVAEDGDGSLVGFAELSIRPCAEGCATDRVAYLEGWHVEPTARRRGIGRLLVEAAGDWARTRGCTELASDTGVSNELGRIAHLGCGFEESGLVRCFRKDLAPQAPAPPESVVYGPASPADLEGLRELLVTGGRGPRAEDPERLLAMVVRADRTVVARRGERIVGFGRALCDGVSNGYLSLLHVHPDWRRRGIGSEIVRRLVGEDPRITWVLRAGNDSPGFWARLGFSASALAMERTRTE